MRSLSLLVSCAWSLTCSFVCCAAVLVCCARVCSLDQALMEVLEEEELKEMEVIQHFN